jgi:hypothetical protein
MSFPIAIHGRLDRLAESGETVRASRAELVAMLIAEADLDPEEIERRILRYRRMTVGDVLDPPELDPTDSDAVVVAMRRPGRPPAISG